MKYLITIIIFVPNLLLGQLVDNYHWPLTFDGQDFEELKKLNVIVDYVWFEFEKVYTKRKLNDTKSEEYIRINDTLYYYKKSLKNEIIEKGMFKLNKTEPIKSDTMTVFCKNFSYEETIEFKNWYEPIKTGEWLYILNDSTNQSGSYINGLKDGLWVNNEAGLKKEVGYLNDEIVIIYNPTIIEIKQNIHWLYDNEFVVSSKHLFKDGVLDFNEKEILSKTIDFKEEDFLTLIFDINNYVRIDHIKKEANYNENLIGSYEYYIDEESNLIIDFKEFGIHKRKLNRFGKTKIR